MVSIIMPVYNAEKYISRTVNSVLNQTYEDFELIMVDDGSTDKGEEVIRKFTDPRVRFFVNDAEDKGAYSARNFGIRKAAGEYIAFLDSDDIWLKDKLEKTLDFMKKNKAPFVFTAYDFGNEDAVSTGKTVHVPEKLTYRKALSRTVIFTSTVLIDTCKVPKELIYMPCIPSEDTATWWNILRKGYTAYGLDESLTIYRRSAGTLSSNKFVAIGRIWNLYRKNEHLGVLKSFYYMVGWAFRAVARRI